MKAEPSNQIEGTRSGQIKIEDQRHPGLVVGVTPILTPETTIPHFRVFTDLVVCWVFASLASYGCLCWTIYWLVGCCVAFGRSCL